MPNDIHCVTYIIFTFLQLFCLFRKQGKIEPVVSVERLPEHGTKRKADTKAGGQAKKTKVETGVKLNVQLGRAPKPKPKEKKPVAVKKTSPRKQKATITQTTKRTTRSSVVKSEPREGVTDEVTAEHVIGTAIKVEVEEEAQSATTDTDTDVKEDPNDPNSKIVSVYALLDIQNEVLQEMRDLKENLRTRYYFEQRFESKLQTYFGITDKKIMERYARQADYNVGDELKVAAFAEAIPDKKKFVYMVQKVANENTMNFPKYDEEKQVHIEPKIQVIEPLKPEQMPPPQSQQQVTASQQVETEASGDGQHHAGVQMPRQQLQDPLETKSDELTEAGVQIQHPQQLQDQVETKK